MQNPVYILGVYYGHTSSVCLLKDGSVVDFVSEERFTNKKNQTGLPKKSIDYILNKNNLTAEAISVVAIPVKITAPIYASEDVNKNVIITMLNRIYNSIPFVRNTFGFVSFYNPLFRPLGRKLYTFFSQTIGRYTASNERKSLAKYMDIDETKIKAYDHHTSHAYSAYHASPYNTNKALVLTLDAEGDGICATVNVFDGRSYRRISSTRADNSLGLLYAGVTKFLGMKVGEHEYKVMGLAPYAKTYSIDKYYPRVQDLFSLGGEKGLQIQSKFDTRQTLVFLKKEMADVRFDVLAGIFQKLLEDIVILWVKAAIKTTGIKTVCLAGGVFMNVKLNQKIAELPEVKNFYVLPSCGDESSPLGAAYIAYLEEIQHTKIKIPPIEQIYWGPEYSNKDVKSFLDSVKAHKKYTVTQHTNIEKKIAQLLAKHHVVARLKGRMEFGARALGNRSILANPADGDVVMVINEQMKDRDFWMPFTPSILEEKVHQYILNPKKLFAPYMIVTFNSSEKAHHDLKAALHPYDFTARPQMVRQSWNPAYHALIREFEALTGIAGVLNTSFNLHGFPIVRGPREAYYAFEHSGLEYLALENYLVSKK